MHCIDCEYELQGLQAGCCPECGRAFDPGDASSYVQRGELMRTRWLSRLLGRGILACGCVPLLANGCGFASLIAARASLGRWPHRGGADDPKSISGVATISMVAMLLLFASFMIPCVMSVLMVMLSAQGAKIRAGQIALVGFVLWLIGILVFWWDPAEVWRWIAD